MEEIELKLRVCASRVCMRYIRDECLAPVKLLTQSFLPIKAVHQILLGKNGFVESSF